MENTLKYEITMYPSICFSDRYYWPDFYSGTYGCATRWGTAGEYYVLHECVRSAYSIGVM